MSSSQHGPVKILVENGIKVMNRRRRVHYTVYPHWKRYGVAQWEMVPYFIQISGFIVIELGAAL